MIPINLTEVEARIPGEWRKSASDALDKVKHTPEKDRAEAINSRSRVWGALKPVLAEVSHDKCWYCESRQARSNKDVDHFRPKNKVTESPTGEGYWWLAFDWQNYRYSCSYCNSPHREKETSGGKHDHFPIPKEVDRGKPEQSSRDLDRQESPTLLDPTKWSDVQLLTFDIGDGRAAPARSKEKDPVGHERATMSIEIYHLHNKDLQDLRYRKMLAVRNRLREATEDLDENSPAYDAALVELWSSILPEAEYSAAAKAMLRGLRGEFPLADEILLGARL
ncbi:MAG: hypothetical protein L0170_13365 [Acidobacteria bacterium]|nr:hypothetical protein [Acidobacteriota bacterium]